MESSTVCTCGGSACLSARAAGTGLRVDAISVSRTIHPKARLNSMFLPRYCQRSFSKPPPGYRYTDRSSTSFRFPSHLDCQPWIIGEDRVHIPMEQTLHIFGCVYRPHMDSSL